MEDYTISEEYTLPSKGKVYSVYVNPTIRLASMTTEHEMRRLAQSERQYKNMCDVIEDCIVGEKPAVHVYDMCLADYQYLLHKLRVVTYGPDYPIESICPYCGEVNKKNINLDEIKVVEYSEDIQKDFTFTLPRSKKEIKLRLQTPRSADDVNIKKKEILKNSPEVVGDPALVLTLVSLIDTVDGQKLDDVKLNQFVRKMAMADTNCILKHAERINSKMGLDLKVNVECSNKECGANYSTMFHITSEFFGPSID